MIRQKSKTGFGFESFGFAVEERGHEAQRLSAH